MSQNDRVCIWLLPIYWSNFRHICILNFTVIFMTCLVIFSFFSCRWEKCTTVTILPCTRIQNYFRFVFYIPGQNSWCQYIVQIQSLRCLSQEKFKKKKHWTMPYMSTTYSSIYSSNTLAVTFKFNRNFPVKILKVPMEFMTVASFIPLLRTQWARLLLIWKCK